MKKSLLLLALATAAVGAADAANVQAAASVLSADPGVKEAAPPVHQKRASHKANMSAAERPGKDGDVTTTPVTTSDLSKIPLFQQAKPLGGYR